jgi:DNA modification methylase
VTLGSLWLHEVVLQPIYQGRLRMAFYRDDRVSLYHGDCLDMLITLEDNSIGAVVTDPPYALSFCR